MKHVEYGERLVVIGDVHGCLDEFETLLSSFPPNSTFLLLGDLVDRGPASAGVVEKVRRMVYEGYAYCVLGNHEESHVRYAKHIQKQIANPNYKIPMRWNQHKQEVFSSLTEQQLEFLSTLPHYLTFTHRGRVWVAVHAGLEPTKTLKEQDTGKLTHIRYVDPEGGKPKSLTDGYEAPAGSVYWTEMYSGRENVVYGHMVHSLHSPRVQTYSDGRKVVGLDTGACFGGKLTAAVFDRNEPGPTFVSVQSKTTYRSMFSWKETLT